MSDHLDVIVCIMYTIASIYVLHTWLQLTSWCVCTWLCSGPVPHGSVSTQPVARHGHEVAGGLGAADTAARFKEMEQEMWAASRTERPLCFPQLSLGKLWNLPTLPALPGREASGRTGAAQCRSGSALSCVGGGG